MTTTTTTTATTGCPCGSVRVTSVTQCLGIHQLHYLPSAPTVVFTAPTIIYWRCVLCASSGPAAESQQRVARITFYLLLHKSIESWLTRQWWRNCCQRGKKNPSGCQYLRFKPSALIMNRMLLLKEKDLVTSLRRWRCAAYLQIFIKQLLLLHYSRKLHKTTLGHT